MNINIKNLIFATILVAFSFSSCLEVKNASIDVVSVKISETDFKLAPNGTKQLTVTVLPVGASDKTLVFSSSDNKIATVSGTGLVTAVAAGKVTITVTSKSNSNISATISVTVVIDLTGLTLSQTTANLDVQSSLTLTPTFTPANATDLVITWSSSDENVATVSNAGVVSTKSIIGTTIITATSVTFPTILAKCTVNVDILLKGLTLSKTTDTIAIDERSEINAIFNPANSNKNAITWAIDKPEVATLETNGNIAHVTGKSVGIAILTATSVSNPSLTATYTVTVTTDVAGKVIATDLVIPNKTLNIVAGQDVQIGASILPENTSDKTIEYESDNLNVATVNHVGLVSGKAEGTANIKVTSYSNVKLVGTVVVNVTIKATGITITPSTNVSILKGGNVQLSASVLPANATIKTVKWQSSAPSIATVDNTGLVNAIASGSSVITVTSDSDPTVTATKVVTVTSPTDILATSLTISNTSLNMFRDSTKKLTFEILPANTTNKTVTWTTDNGNVATVSTEGIITGKGVGTAIITATSNSNNLLIQRCTVNVSINITSITLNKTTLSIALPTTFQLLATVNPADATNKAVTWNSSTPAVATVSTTGLVESKTVGTTTITVTSTSNPQISASCEVTIRPADVIATSLTISNSTLDIFRDSTKKLTFEILPANTTDKTVTWSTDKSNVATVSADGIITGKGLGTAIITATSNSNNLLIQRCTVVVSINLTSITLNNKTLLLSHPNTSQLLATVNPADATNKNVTWITRDVTIASVSQTGLVESKSSGMVIIKVISDANPLISDSCEVTVTDPNDVFPASITLNSTNLTFDSTNKTFQLVPTVLPDNATNKSVNYKSSDPSVATVSSSGLITSKTNGTAVITVTSNSKPTVFVTCNVEVSIKAVNISINQANIELFSTGSTNTFQLVPTILPADTKNKTVTYSSSAPTIASVSSAGLVTAVSGGTATITITSNSNTEVKTTSTVLVKVIAASITLSNTSLSFTDAVSKQLTATILPATTTDKTVTWKSKSEDVATVDANGNITPLNNGVVEITATSNSLNTLIAVCTVNINIPLKFLTYKFERSNNPGMQSDAVLSNYNNDLNVGGDFTYIANNMLKPSFTVPAGTTVKVNDVVQVSGTSVQDFTSEIYYDISFGNQKKSVRVKINVLNDSLDVSSDGLCTSKTAYKQTIGTAILTDSMNGYTIYQVYDFGQNYYVKDNRDLFSISFPNTLTTIGNNAFSTCSKIKQEIKIPASVTTIQGYAFYNTKIYGTINFPEGLTFINYDAFDGTNISGDLIFPASLESMNRAVFIGCMGLNGKVDFSKCTKLKTLPESTFQTCENIKSAILPPNLEEIKAQVFAGCKKLSGSVTIPLSVTSIGSLVFVECNSLSFIYYCDTNLVYNSDSFTGNTATKTLKCF